MKVKLYKIKKDKLARWKQWCDLLNVKYSKEALETLKEEGLIYEGSGMFSLNGETYVLGMYDGTVLTTNLDRELNKQHLQMRNECLESIGEVEMSYQFHNK